MSAVKQGAELHTIEPSHGKERLTAPRLSDVGTVPAADERSRDRGEHGRFKSGNKAAVGRSAKQALTAPLRDARERLRMVLEGQARPEADELLGAALTVFASARLELGSSSVFVLSNLVSFAAGSVLGQRFTVLATQAGLASARGAELLDLAHRCEQQAQRAMTAALAASKALTKRRPGKPSLTPTQALVDRQRANATRPPLTKPQGEPTK